MPIKKGKSYFDALVQAEVLPKQGDMTACQLTQATKAIFLDKGPAEANAYFNQHYQTITQKGQTRDELMVKLFDEVFTPQTTLSFEDFKESNLRSSVVAAKVARESFAVAQLNRIITGKSFDQIEQLFQLYAVLKSETELLGSNYMNDAKAELESLNLNQNQLKKLKQIRERRMALEFAIGKEDVQILHDLANVLKNSKIEVLSKASDTKLQSYMSMFKDMTLEEANQIISRHDKILAQKQTNEADKTAIMTLAQFNTLVQSAVQTVERDVLSGDIPSSNPNFIENWEEDQLSSKTSRLVKEAIKPSEDYE